MVKQRTFILALAVVLLLVLVGSIAFADGNTPPAIGTAAPVTGGETAPGIVLQKGQVCVDGFVINHREQPVDGTKTTPPLVVEAVMGGDNTGVTAQVTSTLQVVATATVGKDGYFKFADLPAGLINFRLQLPQGWEGIVPQARLEGVAETGYTNFVASQTCYRIVFKIRRLVTIPVLKWEERLDGTVVPGEGWKITATPIKDPFARVQTATVTNGQALLTLTPGTWSVAETVKNGWLPLTPPVVTRVVDQYQAPGALNPIVFKNRQPACFPTIVVTKVGYGTNADGGREALGTLAGWKFTVSRADTTWPATTKVTGGDGRAVFDNLQPGVYKVTETVQSGWKPLGDNPVTVVLMDCETVEVTFENQELIGTLSISGKKLFQAWEKPFKGTLVGLPGWTITATLVGTDASITTVTNALGEYVFTQDTLKAAGMAFPGASIKVCEEKRDHWTNKTPLCVTVKFPYPIPPNYTGAKVDFTNVQDPPLAGMTQAPAQASSGDAACTAYHTVVVGDTVAKLAGKYSTSASSIIRANGIRDANKIYLGQRLCIR